MKNILTVLLSITLLLSAQSQSITFTSDELYPEGTAYNAKGDFFYVTSLHYGRIGKVTRDGKYSIFIDDAEIIAAIGVCHDEKRNRL